MGPRKRTANSSKAALSRGVALGLLGAIVACGGHTSVDASAGNAGSGSGSAGTAGSSATGGSGGVGGNAAAGATSGCPAALPVNGSPCTLPSPPPDTGFSGSRGQCSYGDDPRPQCRSTATCRSRTWEVSGPPTGVSYGEPDCKVPALPAACPDASPTENSACGDATLSCWYGDGTRCACSDCERGTPYPICQPAAAQWYCESPALGCPAMMPQAGTPCSSPGASCGPDCSLTITCTDGSWRWARGDCPICAAPDTPISTPDGDKPIASLRVGDLVYSQDHDAIVAVPLLEVGHTKVAHHRVVRVTLGDGRVLEISPGHPTADGRTFGDLLAGGQLDAQHRVSSAQLVPYGYDATYDILPASSTGTYFAAGALIGSTLFRR